MLDVFQIFRAPFRSANGRIRRGELPTFEIFRIPNFELRPLTSDLCLFYLLL